MVFISGENRDQLILLPESVNDYVDENNGVRVIDAYIDQLNLEQLGFVKAQPNGTGRPMYDPKDLLKLYLYGYMNRVRSSRRLEVETKRNLEVIWLMNKLSPDHKTIARFRRDNTAALKDVFRDFVKLCIKLGLYGRELVAIDGSKFKAVNSKDRCFNDKKLAERIARINSKIDEYLHQLEKSDTEENAAPGEKSSEEIAKIITELENRKMTYQGYEAELRESGNTQKSLTDPDSRLMMANGKLDVCYNIQTAVDSKNKLIADFEVTSEAVDKNQFTPMAKKAAAILEADELQAVADVGYDCVQDIVNSMEQGIKPHVAGTDFDICLPSDNETEIVIESHQNGRCVYIAERNIVSDGQGAVSRILQKDKRNGRISQL